MVDETPDRDYRPPPSIRVQYERLTAMAGKFGLAVRTRPYQPYGWQLMDADVEVAAGTLDQIEHVLDEMLRDTQ